MGWPDGLGDIGRESLGDLAHFDNLFGSWLYLARILRIENLDGLGAIAIQINPNSDRLVHLTI